MERTPDLRPAQCLAIAGLTAIAAIVFLRRVGGGVLVDLPIGETIVYTGAFATAAVAALRPLGAAFRFVGRPSAVANVAALLLVVLFVAGLSAQPLSVLAGLAVGATIIGLATAAVIPSAMIGSEAASNRTSVEPMCSPQPVDAPEPIGANTTADLPTLQLVRTNRDGNERLDGLIRFETAPGETSKTLHVPLWPPLRGEPTVQCRLEGIDGRVHVRLAKPHGFRVEVRIPEAMDEPMAGTVAFVVECPRAKAA